MTLRRAHAAAPRALAVSSRARPVAAFRGGGRYMLYHFFLHEVISSGVLNWKGHVDADSPF
jgi:hypothetical protein